ncbi:MAG: GH25 family lysozyme [Myxococcaceae bacterium]
MSKRTWVLAVGLAVLPGCYGDVQSDLEQDPLTGESEAAEVFLGDPTNNAVFALDLSHWEGAMAHWEMECFWGSGVRHWISGTQNPEVTRQQLKMAVDHGMTVDGYVFLFWDNDMAAQVEKAVETLAGFPIGRLWLDAEEDQRGGVPSVARLQQAVDACNAKSPYPCGIYTGRGFWQTFLGDSKQFASLPLWYARYNGIRTLSSWPGEKFGGWDKPAAKQYAEEVLCGVGPDKNVMQVITSPTVVLDRSAPLPPQAPPPPPGKPYPAAGESISTYPYVHLSVDLVPGAFEYELGLETWTGTKWLTYNTWKNARGFIRAYPQWNDRYYRFRARARNALGWGAWSPSWTFQLGKFTGTPPVAEGAAPPPPVTPEPATPAGAPAGLSPDGQTVSASSVSLSVNPIEGATRYEFLLEYSTNGTSYAAYTTYRTTTASKLFSPQVRGATYRWRARAEKNAAFGPWSNDAWFIVPKA